MPEKSKSHMSAVAGSDTTAHRVVVILEDARRHVARTVKNAMVVAYWLIGREIVQELQGGADKAEYGKQVIADLSRRLTERYGRGFSVPNVRNFRQFYLVYQQRIPEIRYPAGVESATGFHPDLSWSHYRALMRVENEEARQFYEQEAARKHWDKRRLERQINTLLFERLLKSRDKDGVLQLANEGQAIEHPIDTIKDPYALEFLGLPESHRLLESDPEAALATRMQEFLLESGAGLAFVARQKRLTLDGDRFYADLVFYHVRLKCYVIIDLKTEKLTHGDIGQMRMYVHYFDRKVCTREDNPTIGLILCTDKDDAVVEYVLDKDNEHIVANRYKLELPTKEELYRLLLEWRSENEGDKS